MTGVTLPAPWEGGPSWHAGEEASRARGKEKACLTATRGTIGVAVAAALLLAPGAAERVDAGSDLGARIEAAESAADHQAIATELDERATGREAR